MFRYKIKIYAVILVTVFADMALPAKAPYRVLFNNDMMNMYGCKSPWNSSGESVEMKIRSAVDETVNAGCDVHMLAPGYGFVPFWKSNIYPYQTHINWWNQTFIQKHNLYTEYMLAGGDMVEVFVNQCRQKGISPFITYRMNDHHMMEFISLDAGTELPSTWADLMIDQWRREHFEYCITKPWERTDLGPDPLTILKEPGMIGRIRKEYTMDWGYQQVRDRIYNFIQELCQYDIDGLELDFMRHHTLFRQDETTSAQRKNIISGFITRVRALLDSTAKPGQHRWLCVRIPAFIDAHDARGIDVQQMAADGVDMFNLSHFYRSFQQSDLSKVCNLVPDAAVYLEMTHTTKVESVNIGGFGEQFLYRRTTDEQFYTAANLAYSRGAQGMSLFNFAYYREYSTPARGPYNEPPFHIIEALSDPAIVAEKPQHYYLCHGWHYYITEYISLPKHIERMIPEKLSTRQECIISLDMEHPKLSQKCNDIAILRVQADRLWADREVTACVNGTKIIPYNNTVEPFQNPYSPLLGTPGTLKAWIIPLEKIHKGINLIKFIMTNGEDINIQFVDIAIK